MMLLKIWRNCHGLELPSIAIEIITAEVLKNDRTYSLYANIKKVFESLRVSFLNLFLKEWLNITPPNLPKKSPAV